MITLVTGVHAWVTYKGANSMLYTYHPSSNIATINASIFDKDSLLRAGETLSSTNSSCLISDPSGEAINLLSPFLQEKGYEIRVFDVTNPSQSHSYNPFDYVKTESDILSLVDSIIGEGEEEKKRKEADLFWSILERHLLSALCALILESRPKEKRNLASVLTLLRLAAPTEDGVSELDRIFEEHKRKYPLSFSVREYFSFRKFCGNTNVYSSVMINCSIKLTLFNLYSVSSLTSSNKEKGIEMEKLFEQKHAIFVTAPNDFSLLSSILFSQFQKMREEREKEKEKNEEK